MLTKPSGAYGDGKVHQRRRGRVGLRGYVRCIGGDTEQDGRTRRERRTAEANVGLDADRESAEQLGEGDRLCPAHLPWLRGGPLLDQFRRLDQYAVVLAEPLLNPAPERLHLRTGAADQLDRQQRCRRERSSSFGATSQPAAVGVQLVADDGDELVESPSRPRLPEDVRQLSDVDVRQVYAGTRRSVVHTQARLACAQHDALLVPFAVTDAEERVELFGASRLRLAQVDVRVMPCPCEGPVSGDWSAGSGELPEPQQQADRCRNPPCVGASIRRSTAGDLRRITLHELEQLKKLSCVGTERVVVAVEREQPPDLGLHRGDLGLQRRIPWGIDQRESLESIEVEEHVSDIGTRVRTASGQPRQIGGATGRRNRVVGRPVVHAVTQVIRVAAIDREGRVNERRLCAARGRFKPAADVEHAIRDHITGYRDELTRRDPDRPRPDRNAR